jgi:threonine efflux protein
MLITQLSTLFVIQLFAVMLPGPDFFMVLRTSLRAGKGLALIVAFGVSSGILIYSSAVVIFLDYLSDSFLVVTRYIGMLGGFYLLYMAYCCFKSENEEFKGENSNIIRGKRTYLKYYLTGLMCNLSNPKVIIAFLSILPLFITKSTSISYHIAIIFILTFSSVIWFSIVASVMGYYKVRCLFIRHISKLENIFGFILIMFSGFLFYEFIVAVYK